MNFDWTTLILEAINFLVLVWLLKRFLYRPVLDIVAQRQAAVAKTLADAEAARGEAHRLRAEYETRRGDWERERARLRQAFEDELDAQRTQRLAALAQELETERRRDAAASARTRDDERREFQARAVQQADAFAARVLERCAGPELDARLADLLLEDLAHLPPARRSAIDDALARAARVSVSSARALDGAVRQRIENALGAPGARRVDIEYSIDPALLAGVRLRAGAWELAADLAGELRAFSQAAGHG